MFGYLRLKPFEVVRCSSVSKLHRPAAQRRFKQAIRLLGIRRNHLPHLTHMPCGIRRFVFEASCQQDALDDVEAGVGPGFEVFGEVEAEQILVHEGLVLLVGEVGRDDFVEEGLVLALEEEVQLVAGVFAVVREFFVVFELRPVQHEGELGEVSVAAERGEEAVDTAEGVVGFEFAGEDVGEGD